MKRVSFTLRAEVIATTITVFRVSNLKEASDIGSKGAPGKTLRITDRSQRLGSCHPELACVLQKLEIRGSSCKRFF